MANKKFTDLTAASTLTGTETVAVVQGANTVKTTAQDIADLAAGGSSTLDGLTDVTITSPTTGQVLKWDGSAWVNDADATGSGGGGVTVTEWSSATTYSTGDWVTHHRSIYQAAGASTNQEPVLGDDSVYWLLIARGGVDGADGSPPAFVGVRAYTGTAQTLATGVDTALALDVETFDTSGFHAVTGSTSRLTVPAGKAGYYMIGGQVSFAANTTGRRRAQVRLNGSTSIAAHAISPSPAGNTYLSLSVLYYLNDNDYLELLATQESGGNLDTAIYQSIGPSFWMTRLA
jgi:hypothetical protein